MSYKGYFTPLLSLSLATTLPFFTQSKMQTSVATTVSSTVPWTGTFLGINAPSTPPTTVSGPFQSSAIPAQIEPSSTNPFSKPATAINVQTTQATGQSILQLLGNPATPLQQKINATFTANTTVGGNPLKITPQTKYRNTPLANAISNVTGLSFTQLQKEIAQPQQSLFPNNETLTAAYQNFMSAIESTPNFLPLFRKLHIIALHELYTYLTGIYTALNMTHIDDVKTYTLTEKKYALNKKTLIVNHLMNVIMAQLNQALCALIPGLPETHAIQTGMICVQSDTISNPNLFVLDLEKSVLAVIGLQKLSSASLLAAYTTLKSYSNLSASSVKNPQLITIIPGSPLQTGMEQLLTAGFSSNALSAAQRTALVTALDTVNSYVANQQSISQLEVVLANLIDPSSTPTATTQQVAQFTKIVTQAAYGGVLTQEITAAQEFATLLGTTGTGTNSTPLTSTQFKILRGIISYILQRYETNSTTQLVAIIQILGELNPTYQTLSPSQSLTLQALAIEMLPSSTTSPALLLQNLNATQRQNLAYGLWVAGTSTSIFSNAEQKTLQGLAILLKQGPLAELTATSQSQNNAFSETLSPAQQTVLMKALTLFSQYTLPPLTAQDFGQALEQNLTAPSGSTSQGAQADQMQDIQNDITQALAVIRSPKFTSFNQLTTQEQILLLQLFQKVDQVFETRLQTHLQQSTQLSYIFAGNQSAQDAFFGNISSAQYETLNALDAYLETHSTVSFSDLIQVNPPSNVNPENKKSWMEPRLALLNLFTVPSAKSATTQLPTGALSQTSSYLSLLQQLQTQHFSNQAITALLSDVVPADVNTYKAALPLLANANFVFSQLSPTTRQALAQLLSNYLAILKKSSTKPAGEITKLNDPNQNSIETVANVIRFTDQYTNMRQSFLGVLKQYLTFFNLYAQTLQNGSNDLSQPAYTGLTEFSQYAQNIQQALQYGTGKEATLQLLAQTNPPLFFYNPVVFRGIKLLPKLALLVEGSSVAPYPTFGIEQAVNGSAQDPTTKALTNNLTSVGDFQYKKFFFLQAPDSTTELVGSLPSWIRQLSVPSSTDAPSYLYEPSELPNDGITGFYMNIPTFEQNPTSNSSPFLRLYEQPIIAQPAWLNKAGSNPVTDTNGAVTADSAGVITVLRGCLGDFQAVLNLGVFDPCLTIIFNEALKLSDLQTSKNGTAPFTTKDTSACTAYITEKQALVTKQNNPATSTTQPADPVGTTLSSGIGGAA